MELPRLFWDYHSALTMLRFIVVVVFFSFVSLFFTLVTIAPETRRHEVGFGKSGNSQILSVNSSFALEGAVSVKPYLKLASFALRVFLKLVPDIRLPIYEDDTDYVEMFTRLYKSELC